MSKREIKEQQRVYVERLLESDLSVPEWCKRYGIAKQSMYGWLTTFADTEPELFGGKQNIVDKTKRRWVESTRLNIQASKALALRPASSGGVVIIDSLLSEAQLPPSPSTEVKTRADSISVSLKGASVLIPPGTALSDVSAVLKVIAQL